MSGCKHKYNTRLKSGVLKRKPIVNDIDIDIDSVSCDCSDSDSDYKYSGSEDDMESGEEVESGEEPESGEEVESGEEPESGEELESGEEVESGELGDDILRHDGNKEFNKLEYYKFLNKLFPSNYSRSKINKIKRQRLYSPNKEFKFKFDKKCKNYDSESNDSIYSSTKIKKNKDKRDKKGRRDKTGKRDKKDKNINIVLNMKGSNSTIYNNNNNDVRHGNDDNKNILDDILYIANNKLNTKDNEEDKDEDRDEDGDEDGDGDGDEDNDMDDYEDKNMNNYDNNSLPNNKIISHNNKIKNLLNLDPRENIIIENSDIINRNENMDDRENSNTFVSVPKKVATKNYKEFSKILDEDDKEEEYFKNNLSKKDQLYYIIKLRQLKELTTIEKPYLIHLMNLDIPDEYKACALRKINIIRSMGCGFGNSEYYKIKSWIDAFIKIPFNKYNNLPITFADGIEECHAFMENAKNTLDRVAFGLEDAKIQIMQMIGLWLVNPNAVGSAIAIKGPPGTGKTTLIKEGISKILNRPFAMIALGGCGDSGFLDGHDYTYEGSKYGKIIDILIQSGCMNPVILFDELDKLSDSPRGQEITGVLTHLTDTTQNSRFTDKYMSEISLDMSKALYIFSYNDESKVNLILKDRMYKIETNGYKTKDKLVIAKDYLLPKIREQAKFEEGEIIFNDEILEYIINDYTEKESGVRNLKRCLEIIHTKLNLYRLMKPDVNLFENSDGFKLKKRICFPATIRKENVDELLIKGNKNQIPFGMYI